MELYVNQDEYVDQLSPEAGYRIVISPPGVMPFPFEEGISVVPGLSTSIGIRKVTNLSLLNAKNIILHMHLGHARASCFAVPSLSLCADWKRSAKILTCE